MAMSADLRDAITAMNALPDISATDSKQLQGLMRMTAVEIKAVGGVGAATSLEMIGYIRELEQALSSRDAEIREVLEGLGVELPNGWCWCPGMEWSVRNYTHTNTCKLTQALYAKLQPGKGGEDVTIEKD